MKFVPIFDPPMNLNHCFLWTVCIPEDEVEGIETDIFSKLFDLWTDTAYLQTFLSQNVGDLITNPFWKQMSISEAIDKIIAEADDFQEELLEVDQLPEIKKTIAIKEIFKNLHNDEFIFLRNKDESFRKGRPNVQDPMLRLYGILLEDCIIITGGAIKLTKQMNRPHLQKELSRLQRVKDFLKSEQICNKNGLLE